MTPTTEPPIPPYAATTSPRCQANGTISSRVARGSDYGASYADDIHVADDGTITIAGTAHNTVAGRSEAIVWRSGDSVPGDVDGDGQVGVADLLAVLSAWGDCAGCPEDLDGDGAVGVSDLLTVLAHWS